MQVVWIVSTNKKQMGQNSVTPGQHGDSFQQPEPQEQKISRNGVWIYLCISSGKC